MTGYRGRFSIVEVLTMNPELERRISEGAAAEKIAEAARAGGMRSLFASGLRHVLSGESTIEELLRVTEPPHEDAAAAPETAPRAGPRGPGRVSAPHAAPRGRVRRPLRCRSSSPWTCWTSRRRTEAVGGEGKGRAPVSCWWRTRSSCAG